ncbi:uncharacterized protein CLUP02_10332 [Colletotrichum lupini]|uniref:Uncharacterized protein n=1 Tax=Colletotrichum lupini TaxID=145971 RepID=A0A9Q8SY35_9PEZI|nr:uncharacterized protein CLUP02_10332 [Colletotrichum lupini]UQC84836.1 hypothetical protein CLUP02_10332 [Colletotrichum lupini]
MPGLARGSQALMVSDAVGKLDCDGVKTSGVRRSASWRPFAERAVLGRSRITGRSPGGTHRPRTASSELKPPPRNFAPPLHSKLGASSDNTISKLHIFTHSRRPIRFPPGWLKTSSSAEHRIEHRVSSVNHLRQDRTKSRITPRLWQTSHIGSRVDGHTSRDTSLAETISYEPAPTENEPKPKQT